MEAAASPSSLLCLAIRAVAGEGRDLLGRRNNHLHVLVLSFGGCLARALAASSLELAFILHRGGATYMVMSRAGTRT